MDNRNIDGNCLINSRLQLNNTGYSKMVINPLTTNAKIEALKAHSKV